MSDDKITAKKIWFTVPSRKAIELSSGHIFAPGAVVGIGLYVECDGLAITDHFDLYLHAAKLTFEARHDDEDDLRASPMPSRSAEDYEDRSAKLKQMRSANRATHRALYAEAKRKLLGVE
jgi:hypothetical protein